jgi:hypothetical protein
MKKRTKAQVTKLAKDMAAMMADKRWKPRVWENMGWHYEINLENENMSFSVDKLSHDGEYDCSVQIGKYHGTHDPIFGEIQRGKTPQEAFEKCLKQVKARLDAVKALYAFGKGK